MRLDLDRVADRDARTVDGGARSAAVLASVIERDGAHRLLFIRRADDLSEHAGQMSFPGGGHEPDDDGLRETALREAGEEVGLRAGEAEIVGRLDEIHTITDYSVRPYVARVADREYVPDGNEAAAVVVLPVAALLESANYEFERRVHPEGGEVVVHYFRVDGHTVWGATAKILVQLLELTTDWRRPETVDRVVDPDADVQR